MGEMRLRQICLVTPHLEPVVGDIKAIMGLEVCYRDPGVGKYGLENALLPVDTTLLEVVAPTQEGTAAGRFLDKSRGFGGYMAIFSCDDPDERGRHAQDIGVRIANIIEHPPYRGVQLHPRDCRAAFIEFNRTEGVDDALGPYPPAGPDWHRSIRNDTTLALIGVELQGPDPEKLAQHWGNLIGLPVSRGEHDAPQIVLPNAYLRFMPGGVEALTGLTFKVRDVAQVVDAARCRGSPCGGENFLLGGVTFHIVG
jgi:hypothetical protein